MQTSATKDKKLPQKLILKKTTILSVNAQKGIIGASRGSCGGTDADTIHECQCSYETCPPPIIMC